MKTYKKLFQAEQFHIDQKPWPEGVFDFNIPGHRASTARYRVSTAGNSQYLFTTISDGDWIVVDNGERHPVEDKTFQKDYVLQE